MSKVKLAVTNICLVFVSVACSIQIGMVILSFTNPNLATKISKEVIWKLDGTFN